MRVELNSRVEKRLGLKGKVAPRIEFKSKPVFCVLKKNRLVITREIKSKLDLEERYDS